MTNKCCIFFLVAESVSIPKAGDKHNCVAIMFFRGNMQAFIMQIVLMNIVKLAMQYQVIKLQWLKEQKGN